MDMGLITIMASVALCGVAVIILMELAIIMLGLIKYLRRR